MSAKNQDKPAEQPVNAEELIAKAKAEAEAEASKSAEDIIAKAKAEAERIIAEAKSTDDDVATRAVGKKELIKAYEKGMSHMEIAIKFYGSTSDENMRKVASVINPKFEIDTDIDPEVSVTAVG